MLWWAFFAITRAYVYDRSYFDILADDALPRTDCVFEYVPMDTDEGEARGYCGDDDGNDAGASIEFDRNYEWIADPHPFQIAVRFSESIEELRCAARVKSAAVDAAAFSSFWLNPVALAVVAWSVLLYGLLRRANGLPGASEAIAILNVIFLAGLAGAYFSQLED
jgi:hypothetical protein